jgi:1,4-alpha-glucan branching enzyme
MKRILLVFFAFLFCSTGIAQLLTWTPSFPTETSSPIVITVDATKGNLGLNNYATTSDVYIHTGVITSSSTSTSDWRYVKFNQNFTSPNASLQATYIGGNKWQFTITGGLRAYYGVPVGETIQKIALLFRSGNGSLVQRNADGSDMYIPVYGTSLATRLTVPPKQPTFIPKPEQITKVVGNTIAITGVSNIASNLKLYFNGAQIQAANGATTISVSPGPTITTAGTQTIMLEASDGVTTKYDTIKFFVAGTVTTAALPAGVRDGINYEANTSAATFVLYAPNKNRVSIIGDLPGSNWDETITYQMNKTPDGNYWWLRVTGLTPGTEYSFQYLIDGTLRVSDPYVEKVLDPWNDQYISSDTYPGLKPYPTGFTTGIVGILQTAAPSYNWQTAGYTRPDKKKLVIYELLLRDFIGKHDWKTMRDTINYLKNLGVNAIQFMPINEFEGNNSWGYNPDFYFAPDKYYGPKNDLKQFIDLCHSKGIAVIMDIALNHSFGLSPMVQMYFDAANNRPAANNPWFNPAARHAFNVGYDMNHESLATRYFVSRVVEHWLVNYKIDGFRFDLSKGFTQTSTCDANGNNCNVGGWSSYDLSRINIWKRYYDSMQLKAPGSYAILEHFAANNEEVELSNYGFLLWGNMNYNYSQASMGYNSDWDFSYGIHTNRGWSNPHLISYMESHDEERVNYRNISFGNAFGGYNVKDTNTAPKRLELAHAFLLTIPGPKMIWQFGELAYDSSINFCQNGTINANCRTDPKPIRWGYYNDVERRNLYNVIGNINRLRQNPIYSNMFASNNITYNLSGAFKWIRVTEGGASMVVIGNFDVASQTGSVTFPTAGTWYNYLNPGTFSATGGAQSFTLQPGEYRIYINQFVVLPVSVTSFTGKNSGLVNQLKWNVTGEQNLSHYELERSLDGRSFTSVATITAMGRSSYAYADNISTIPSPVFFYRLRMVDADGSYRYSSVVKLNIVSRAGFIEVAPNPFSAKLTVRIESETQDMATIVVNDLGGRQLLRMQKQLQSGNNAFDITEAGKFANGVYMVTITTKESTQTIKVTKGN